MKIGILSGCSGSINITERPAEFRPLGFCRDRYEITGDFDEADWVYFYLDYLDCNRHFAQYQHMQTYQQYKHKGIVYAMHDNPAFAYSDPEVLKFIAQPLRGREENTKYNIVSVPLQMRHFEWEVIQDEKFIEEIRNIPKTNDFCFIGQTRYQNRRMFRPENIKLPVGSSYDFEDTKPIWGVSELQARVKLTKDFIRRVAASKFCFAPRGIGSNSFRLYQSLISGTIPIIYGMLDRPFSDELDWGEFSVNGDWNPDTKHFAAMLSGDLEQPRRRAIEVWDNYFHMEKTDQYIFDRYLEKK